MSSSVEQGGDAVLLECCRWLAEAGVVNKAKGRNRDRGVLDWGGCVCEDERSATLILD
jgi:hypothetical protein